MENKSDSYVNFHMVPLGFASNCHEDSQMHKLIVELLELVGKLLIYASN